MSRTYAIPDIHGRIDLLDLASMPSHAMHGDTSVLLLPWGLHRPWSTSREVVECLMNRRLDGYEHFNLKGNNEAMMLAACRAQAELGWWIRNGGNSTLAPYGEAPDHPDLRAIPPGHLGWMESCLLSTWTDTSARSEICELDDFDTPKLSQLNKSILTAANACDL